MEKSAKKTHKKIYSLPKTKIGKVSFWLVISGVILIVLLNAISAIMSKNDICNAEGCEPAPGDWELNDYFISFTRILPALLAMACIIIAGVTSIIAITKHHDRAILLFISALIGVLGVLFVLGEFLFPH